MKKLKEHTKKELWAIIRGLKGRMVQLTNHLSNKQGQIKHFRIMLYKLRNSIDYLIKHPYSCDKGMTTNKHTRDSKMTRKGGKNGI